MKKAAFSHILSLLIILLFTACTPADKPVTDAETRAKLKEQFHNKAKGGGSNKLFQVGSYQMAALIMDKQVEAIEMLRLALKVDDGAKSNTKINNLNSNEGGYSATLSLDPSQMFYSIQGLDYVLSLKKMTKVEVQIDKQAQPQRVKITLVDSAKQSLDRKTQPIAYINLFENKYIIEATISNENSDLWLVKMQTVGGLNGKEEGVAYRENYEMQIDFEVDAKSLAGEQVKIAKFQGELSFLKDAGMPPYKVNLNAEHFEIKPDGLCNTLLGTIKIASDRNGRTISYSDKAVQIDGTRFVYELAACHKRPTVDLSRVMPQKK